MLAGGRQSVRHKAPGRASGEGGSDLVVLASNSGSDEVTRLGGNPSCQEASRRYWRSGDRSLSWADSGM